MRYKFFSLSITLFILLFPVTQILAFTHIDNINDGISVFFLLDLEAGENIEINITHSENGNFTLFLFDNRPNESFVNLDKTLRDEIFNKAINYSLSDNPYINYTVSETKIYYIQLILVENGPDTFFLSSNKDLTRYYLPIIPGYQTNIIIFSILLVVGLFFLTVRKRISKS